MSAATLLNLQVNSPVLPRSSSSSISCCFVIKVFSTSEATVARRRPTHQWHSNLASWQWLWMQSCQKWNYEVTIVQYLTIAYTLLQDNSAVQSLLWKKCWGDSLLLVLLFSCLEENQGDFPRNTVITCIPRIRVIFHRNAPKSFPRIWVNFLGQTGASISSKNSPLLNWHKKSRVRESGAGEKSKSQIDKNLFSEKKYFKI